jgi:hypothetical protein
MRCCAQLSYGSEAEVDDAAFARLKVFSAFIGADLGM